MLVYFLIIVNLITFILFGIDKKKAMKNKYRISEKTLLGFSAIGGAAGGIAGMQIFRHKTKTPVFVILMPVFLIIHIVIIYCLIK